MPLADEGYGITQVITFLLHIENEILRNKLKDDRLTLKHIFTETYIDGTPLYKNEAKATLAIEEPEVSLHPSLQSQLTDIFYDAYNSYGVEFIIETHSEYLIRRTQAIVANMTSENEYINRPFAVYYVDKGGQTYELKYLESGRFENNFGPGFFDEASRSSIQILQREKRMKK
jgi:predicted ATPase